MDGTSVNGADGEAPSPGNLDRVTLDESVRIALLALLDSLTPAERVAFVLHDVFTVPFDIVADVVGRTPHATMSLAESARRHIQAKLSRDAAPVLHEELTHAFRLAWEARDPIAFDPLLAPGVVALMDGGGKATAETHPVRGVKAVTRMLVATLAHQPDTQITEQSVNGQTGLVIRRGGSVVGVVSLNTESGRVSDIWMVVNPDKLRHWNDE